MNAHGTTCSGCAPALGIASEPGVPFLRLDNERSLALHHICKAQASTFSFERPKEFDLAQYDGDGRFGFGYGEKVHLSNWV